MLSHQAGNHSEVRKHGSCQVTMLELRMTITYTCDRLGMPDVVGLKTSIIKIVVCTLFVTRYADGKSLHVGLVSGYPLIHRGPNRGCGIHRYALARSVPIL